MKGNHGVGRATRLGIVCVLLGGLLFAAGLPGGAIGAAEPTIAQVPAAVAHAGTLIGRTAATQAVTLSVPLKPADTKALDTFLADLYDSTSPNYHQYLTPQQFTQRFFDASARNQVVAYLQGAGFAVDDPGVGATITATGTAALAERAFGVTLSDYRDAAGNVYHVNDLTPALPVSVADRTYGIAGLDTAPAAVHAGGHAPDTVSVPDSGGGPKRDAVCTGATNAATANHTLLPAQFATAYNMDALYAQGYHGEGQTIALFELSDYHDGDITTYQTCFGASASTVFTRVPVGSFTPTYSGEGEAAGDIEEVIGAAPQLAKVLVYDAQNSFAGILAEYQKIANDNLAPVISSSWFACEQNETVTVRNGEYAAFQQMAAQGQTMLAIAGDWGSASCYIFSGHKHELAQADPGTQPYVTSVGGTKLTVNGSNQWSSEAVWNDYGTAHNYGSGGGGVSILWPRPTYQTGPGTVSATLDPGNMRTVPDVTATGDLQFTFYVANQGGWGAYYGTSFGTPLWAAGVTLINQYLLARGDTRLGFANPTLYRAFNDGSYAAAFHDITSGNNCWDPSSPCGTPTNTTGDKYTSAANYDYASGIGSPNFGALATVLTGPTIVGISPASGGLAGGNRVTITGTKFVAGISVSFAGVPATNVTVLSATTLTAIAPASATAGAVDVTATSPSPGLRIATLTGGYTYGIVNALPDQVRGGTISANPGPSPNGRPGGTPGGSPDPAPPSRP